MTVGVVVRSSVVIGIKIKPFIKNSPKDLLGPIYNVIFMKNVTNIHGQQRCVFVYEITKFWANFKNWEDPRKNDREPPTAIGVFG